MEIVKYFIFFILSFLIYQSYGQPNVRINSNEKTCGKDFRTNNEYFSKEIIFPERIENYLIDTNDKLLIVYLRGVSENGKWLNNKGSYIIYDLTKRGIKLHTEINYQNTKIGRFNDFVIKTEGYKSYCYSFNNRNLLWDKKNTIHYVNNLYKIGIGYKYKSSAGLTNILEGINLINGRSLWQREISGDYSWNEILNLNDSVILIAASGLHSINLKTGKGWDFNAITGVKNYTNNSAVNALGLGLGLLTGTFGFTSGGYDLVRDVVSNVLVDSSGIYFASLEKISRLNHNGKVIFGTPLPTRSTSKSAIFTKDSLLYIVNYGYAYMGNKQMDFGKPFFAAFNKNFGYQVFFKSISANADQISDFNIYQDTAFIILKNRILKYNIKNGELIADRIFETNLIGDFKYFIGSQVYIQSDTGFTSLISTDSTKRYLFTKNGRVIVLNDQLEITGQLDYAQLYFYYLKRNNFKFLERYGKTIIIDNDDKIVAELLISANAVPIGSKLYDLQGNSIIEIDIENLK